MRMPPPLLANSTARLNNATRKPSPGFGVRVRINSAAANPANEVMINGRRPHRSARFRPMIAPIRPTSATTPEPR